MAASPVSTREYATANRGLTDLALRFAIMDKFPDVRQILTIAGPNIESITAPADAAVCARIANDEMAALVAAHPDRFIGACACLPMSDVDAALAEAERAIDTLGFRRRRDLHRHRRQAARLAGVPADLRADGGSTTCRSCCTRAGPTRPSTTRARPHRSSSSTRTSAGRTNRRWPWRGWLSAACMERFPNLKIITHHAGGLVPFFHKRIELSWDFNEQLMGYAARRRTT